MLLEALLGGAAGLALGCAVGFAIAWTLGGRAREELAAAQARAEAQERATEEIHADDVEDGSADADPESSVLGPPQHRGLLGDVVVPHDRPAIMFP